MARVKVSRAEVCLKCGSVLKQVARRGDKEGPSPDERWLFVGMTGTGKSTKHKELMRAWLEHGRAVVAWDVDDEMSRAGRKRPGLVLGPLEHRVTFSEFMENPSILTDAELSLAVVPEDPEEQPQTVAEQFLEFSRFVRARGDCILALTEMGYWSQATTACAERVDVIATKWRKDGVAVSGDTQFLVQVPAGFRSQVTRFYAFKQAKAAHVTLLAQETSPAFARQVRRLGKYQCLVADVWDEPDDTEE